MRRLLVDTTPLRVSPDFRRLWLGQAVSFFGTMITTAALPYQVFHATELVARGRAARARPARAAARLLADRRRARRQLRQAAAPARGQHRVARVFGGARLQRVARPSARLGDVRSRSGGQRHLRVQLSRNPFVAADAGEGRAATGRVRVAIDLRHLRDDGRPAVGGLLIGAFGITTAYGVDVATFVDRDRDLRGARRRAAGARAGRSPGRRRSSTV